ncbi:TorF family putative porin [Brevundimonas sp. 2R-24]|uniref:TorF family putative porin n=1 Tax=Peiella sedimenti TaxID=3061083 RepID=A0ABT8SMS0_9CAUL|nr:TorF family putative porin [Caulobacteraceae bacterium XZ-24]
MARPIALAAAAALLFTALPAVAQESPAVGEVPGAFGGGSWSFQAGAFSDYRSKGASKTGGDPYAYGAVEWASASDVFYAGAEVSNIESSTGADTEIELAVGYRPEAFGYNWDFNAAHKSYLGARPGQEDQAWEFTSDVSRSIGPASGRLRFQYSPDSAGSTRSWTWVEARAGWKFTPDFRTTAAIGRREQVNGVDYTAWNIGATYRVNDNLDFDVRWYDTSEDGRSPTYDSQLVAGFNVYF